MNVFLELKSFLSGRTRKLVLSPDEPPKGTDKVLVRVLNVTRSGWKFDCPLKGKRTLLFEDMTEEQARRILSEIACKGK
jgi:hypothetical protein